MNKWSFRTKYQPVVLYRVHIQLFHQPLLLLVGSSGSDGVNHGVHIRPLGAGAVPMLRVILGPEYEVARALIEARTRAGLTQAELAARMKTTQSAVARLESGRTPPSTRTLEKVARATGTRLRIQFDSIQ